MSFISFSNNEAETKVLGGGFVGHINDFILHNSFRYNIIYSEENDPMGTPSKLMNDWCSKKIKRYVQTLSALMDGLTLDTHIQTTL